MANINPGVFKNDHYIKQVSFAKAVLWKSREISLSPKITNQFLAHNTKKVIFQDLKKNEQWTADVETLRANRVKKTVGQEEQWYFPISIFTKSPIRKNEPAPSTAALAV